MADIHDFIKEHPTAIVRGYVPIADIIGKIKSETNASDILTGDIPDFRMHCFNAFNLPSNDALNLTEEQLQIKAIRIPITEATEHYTAKDFVSVNCYDDTIEEYIYLVYEEKVHYLYSNSNKLFLEAVLAHGIPEEDIVNKTEEYTSYLFYLQCYLDT